MKISVVGLGKLGSPIVAVFAAKGYDVVGIDTNPIFVEKINNHIAPVEEPQLQELLTAHKARISATTDWTEAVSRDGHDRGHRARPQRHRWRIPQRLCIVGDGRGRAGTGEEGRLSPRRCALHHYAGFGRRPIRQRLERASGRKRRPELGLCYNPEFIAFGDVINGLLHPDFVLIGESDRKAGDLLEGVYRKVVGPDANVARMNFVNAELTKISVNTYVTMKISFANMLGEICDRLEGADVSVVADAIGQTPGSARNI